MTVTDVIKLSHSTTGCSSILGMFTELGPFDVTKDDGSEITLNPYSWNRRANMLFIESPVGVGYSFAIDGKTKTNDDITAKGNYLALKDFFEKFPTFKKNKFFMTGESYAGVYLPTLAVLVDDDKDINFGGVAIGNGYLDSSKLGMSLIFFSYHHGLIGKKVWQELSDNCCKGAQPTPSGCTFMDPNRSRACESAMLEATDAITNQAGMNPYNIYDVCLKPTTSTSRLAYETNESLSHDLEIDYGVSTNSYMKVGQDLIMRSLNLTSAIRAKPSNNYLNLVGDLSGPVAHCPSQDGLTNYMNRKDVQKAIHICPAFDGGKWIPCGNIPYTMQYPILKGGLAPQMQKLLHSPRNLNLLIYNGDVDMVCNFLGDEWFVEDLNMRVVRTYSPWSVDGIISGYVKFYDGITFLTVKGSGHMVPGDKPKEALAFFEAFLDGKLSH